MGAEATTGLIEAEPPCRAAVAAATRLLGDSVQQLLELHGVAADPLELAGDPAHSDVVLAVVDDPAHETVARAHRAACDRGLPLVVATTPGNGRSLGNGSVRLTLDRPGDSFARSLVDVCNGHPGSAMARAGGARRHPPTADEDLTPREREVLGLLADGSTPAEIAGRLAISQHTVRTHVQNAMSKLGARSRAEAVAMLRRSRPRLAAVAPEPTGAMRADALVLGWPQVVAEGLVASLAAAGLRTEAFVGSTAASIEAVVARRPRLVAVRGGDDVVIEQLIPSIAALPEAPPILLVTPSPDPRLLAEGVRAGAEGYVSEDGGIDELVSGVEGVLRGEATIPPTMLSRLLRDLISQRREEDDVLGRFSRLTRQERRVLALLEQGGDAEAVARTLVVSLNTARSHIQRVLGKLEVHSQLEAASMARRHRFAERFGTER